MEKIKLTEYAHGAGCGCKIAPQVLQSILATDAKVFQSDKLIVGNESKDDAAVYDLGNNRGLISTTDFFTPIVNDAFDFGRIAATNALSDVYAMGGSPFMALAVLGFPVDKLPVEIATQILNGARAVCNEANVVLAGGHSIDSPEPIFGLSVNGEVNLQQLKKNNTVREGDLLYLTKPLGVGILATAEKRGALQEEHIGLAVKYMTELNSLGRKLGEINAVHAMTDVTGFGLAGHLLEMIGDSFSAELFWNKLPIIEGVKHYVDANIIPDATYRNWNAYGSEIEWGSGVPIMDAFKILPDPQTSGGLLFAVNPAERATVETLLKESGYAQYCQAIGSITERKAKAIFVGMD
jgi:selenide,water dikinase